ncbi:MAG: hypothetical protein WA705_26810 [Candidatus Ozemobacteraceae bacterium]
MNRSVFNTRSSFFIQTDRSWKKTQFFGGKTGVKGLFPELLTKAPLNARMREQALATPFLKATVPVMAGTNDILDPSTDVTKTAIASLSSPEMGKNTSENNGAKPVQVVPSAGPFAE